MDRRTSRLVTAAGLVVIVAVVIVIVIVGVP